jgi:LuxR family transcriptional regulator, maltose regulon positive regulatory protein
MRRGRVERATAEIRRAVELSRRGIARIETAYGLLSLAEVSWIAGAAGDAGALIGEARQVVERCPDPGIVAEMLAEAEPRLGVDPQVHGAASTGDELTERELAVLRLLPTGLSQREIGEELLVSLNTVKTHVRAIYRKLDAATRPQAIGRARELHLL